MMKQEKDSLPQYPAPQQENEHNLRLSFFLLDKLNSIILLAEECVAIS